MKKYYAIGVIGLIAFLAVLVVLTGGTGEDQQQPTEQSSGNDYSGLGK